MRDIGLRVFETLVNTPLYCWAGGVGRTPVEENGLFRWEEGAFWGEGEEACLKEDRTQNATVRHPETDLSIRE